MKTLLVLFVCVFAHVANAQVVWTKAIENPIVPSGGIGNLTNAIEPSVTLDEQTGLYRMWFCSQYSGSLNISAALSNNGKHWFTYLRNPVLTGSDGFDAGGIYSGEVIYNGTQHMMYYSGTNGSVVQIGLATSIDGISWTKYAGNPVITVGLAGSWESNMAVYPRVLYDGSMYRMWYGGKNPSTSSVGYATSPDGVSWTKHPSNPVLVASPTAGWDDHEVQAASVTKFDSLYYMMYVGTSISTTGARMGLAYSLDGIQWTKHGNVPLLLPGSSGSWDNTQVGGGTLKVIDGIFHFWYSGLNGQWQIGLATSPPATLNVPGAHAGQPREYSLEQSYPNPFNPATLIQYNIPKRTHVKLAIYDALGREVAVLVDGLMTPGTHSVQWTSNVSSGTYWYRMITDEFTSTKTMVLLK